MNVQLRIVNQEPPVQPVASPAWLGYGFRPFFLGAALVAPLLMLLWVAEVVHGLPVSHATSSLQWHGHEMIYGFVTCVVAGFLLTAVPNWTGLPTPRGWALGALFLLWSLPRVGMLIKAPALLPVTAILDLAFLPCLAVVLAIPLVRAHKPNNLVFVPILLCLTAGNACFWSDILGYSPGTAPLSKQLGIGLILLLIGIIGGRVIPFFASRAIHGLETRSYQPIELLSAPCLIGAMIFDHPLLAVLAGVVHLVRLYGWSHRDLWRHPLLWVLYVSYAFLGIGFLLKAAVGPVLALHAHTVGCISVMILGMMARVALGHSGRELKPAPLIVGAFALMSLAGLTRVFLPLLVPSAYLWWLAVSGCLWAVAFLSYAFIYIPILVSPRADGKPG